MNKKLFNPLTRYQTKGIEDLLDNQIKIFLWKKIDLLISKLELDYLQVFEFSVIESNLIIEHRQEIPLYNKKYILTGMDFMHKLNGIIVFVIDNFNYSMMMLSTEY